VLETWLAYRTKARNTSTDGENRIHDDAVARTYGFRGGLVPGVTVYAYATRSIVAALGPGWLERGGATVRFLKPVVDGEAVTVTGGVTARDASGVTGTVVVSTEATPECATASVTLPAGRPTPVNVGRYPAAPLPDERPAATREHLLAVDVLGTPRALYDEARADAYLAGVEDDLALYRGRGWVHPAFYLDQANRALDRNVRMGPWIHVGSTIRHLGGARVGETLATRGRVRSLFEKRGREFVEVDLLIVAEPAGRPVAHVLHTAIYRLPPPA
jgi:acyl dehydratase